MRQTSKPAALNPFQKVALVLALFLLDRLSKYWVIIWLKPRYNFRIARYFYLNYVENTGMAFSVGPGRNHFFIGLSLLLLSVLLYLQRAWSRKNIWLQIGLLLVIAGALGNLYDRIFYGHVVDFLDFRVWPVFNAADSCVCVGACCLALGMYLEDKETI